jgi:hypothetical protein
MSTNTQNDQDQEIDLTQVFKKISGFFDGIATSIFKGILFIKKNILILISLFIIGAGLGYYLDFSSKTYNHDVIVSPNFGSLDYLYNKVNLIKSRIKQRDTLYLKSIGIADPKIISNITISPIIDIYSFVGNKAAVANNAQNSQNFELVKLLSEDGDINKVIKDTLTSRNYGSHKISITTKGFTTNKNTIDPILKYLNNSEFYEKIRKITVSNTNTQIKNNQQVINQIDGLVNQFASSINNSKNDKLVYYNENTQLNDFIASKNGLNNEILNLKTSLITSDKIIMDTSRVINVLNNKGTNAKMKFYLPLLLILGFILFGFFKSFYKKQAAKLKA